MFKFLKEKLGRRHKIRTAGILLALMFVMVVAILWLLNQEKMNQEQLRQQKLENIAVFFPEEEISALLFDGHYIWVGGRGGVFLMDPETGKKIKTVAKDIEMIYTAGICQTSDGSIWVGHAQGITVFNGEERLDYGFPEIPKGRVNTIIKDQTGGVWAGVQSGAVHFTRRKDGWGITQVLSGQTGLRDNVVNAIGIDRWKAIWFGSYLGEGIGGISILKENKWEYFSVAEGLPHRFVTSILPLVNGSTLVGCGHLDRGGMALFQQTRDGIKIDSVYSTANGLPGEKIRHLYLDSKKHLWITSESDGLLICPSDKTLAKKQLRGVYLTVHNGLSDNEIKTIIETEKYYWLGGRVGITRIDKATIELLFVQLMTTEKNMFEEW